MAEDSSHTRSRRRSFMQALGAIGAGAAINPVSSAAADVGSYYQSLQDTLTGEEGVPAEGEFVYADNASDTLAGFELVGEGDGTATKFQTSADVPFSDAVRVENPTETQNAYANSFKRNITGRTIEDGDVLLAVVYLRGEVPADVGDNPTTQAGFKYQYSEGYSSNSIAGTAQVNPGSEWKRYYFPIEVTKPDSGSDFRPYLEFWTGYGPQTLEFGGLALLDYSNTDVTVDDLPVTEFSYDYEGRAEDAAWRDEAEQRIDELRKTDFEVNVVGPDGNPVEGADVQVEMTEHEFPFGTAASLGNMGAGDSGNAQYESVLTERFNKVTIENGLKAPYYNQESAVDTLDWLNEQDIPVRGHALFWGEWEWMLPPEAGGVDSWPDGDINRDDVDWSDERIKEEVRKSIKSRANTHQGQVVEWDMENHPIMFPEMREYFGNETVREWWQVANEADPEAGMVVNDMQVLGSDSQLEPYHDYVSSLVDNGVGIDAVGFMAHFGLDQLTPPTEVWSRLDRFAELGLDLQITEFDVQINDRSRQNEVDAQTDYVRDFLTACFAHEAMDTFISWGFWAGDHWRPTAAYYNQDWSLRKHGQQYLDLVFGEWWTEKEGTTDANGAYSARAFKGDHEVVASTEEWYGRTTATFDDENGTVEVQIAPIDVGNLELSADSTELTPGDESDLAVTVTSTDGVELPLGGVTYESSDESVVTVSEQGVVTAQGGGEATVTVTAPAFRDTAVGSVEFSVTAVIEDEAESLEKTYSNENVSAMSYASRHGDGTFFEKADTGSESTLTYRLEDGIESFRVVSYVNYNALTSDTFDDLIFEASTDGSSYQTVEPGSKDIVEASGDNGYYAKWTHTGSDLPDGATYFRVRVPAIGDLASYNVAIGSVSVSSAADTFGGGSSGAYGDLAVDDPATDFSKVESSTAMETTSYESRYGQDTRLRKSDATVDSHLTYRVEDSISAFRVTGIVNTGGAGDFSDFTFAVSSDGETFEEIEYGSKSTVAGDDSNGHYDQWTYLTTENVPEDARYLRVTLPPIPTGNLWSVNVGTVKIWTGGSEGTTADNTGPVVVVDGLAPATYNGAPDPSTTVTDPETEVTARSFTLDGEPWSGGAVRQRGEHTFELSATNADDATTATAFEFTTVHDTDIAIENRRGRPGRPAAFVVTLTDAVTGEPLPGRPVALWADGQQVTTEETQVDGQVTIQKGKLFSKVPPKGGDVKLRAVYDGEDTVSLNGSEAETTISPGNGKAKGKGNGTAKSD